MDTVGYVLEFLVAVGTISVAIVAIWGDWFKHRFAAPKLSMKLRDTKGNPTTMNGHSVMYYHLIVENRREWAIARGVQVMLTGIWRRVADGSYKPEILAAELPLTWSYPQINPLNPSIKKAKRCDFGLLQQEDLVFKPSLYIYPNNFKGYVRANESVRFSIEIQADNYSSQKPYLFQVDWDGTWANDLSEMEKHLVVQEIKTTT
jgi:hypothetical protein